MPASKKVMDMFNKEGRIGALATASKDGKPNVAVFGSPRMIDENTVVMGIGDNRSFTNLQDNPEAVFICLEPGPNPMQYEGCRIYLKMTECQTSGEALDNIKKEIAQVAGEGPASMIRAAITFEITETRPLIDLGQGI